MEREKNVVVCIWQKNVEETDMSSINRLLCDIQEEEKEKRKKVNWAFVYGDGIVRIKDFGEVENINYYAAPVEGAEDVAHIFLMGLAVMEKKQKSDIEKNMEIKKEDYYIYLLIESDLQRSRVGLIKSMLKGRFRNLKITPVLVKSGFEKDTGLDSFFEECGGFCRPADMSEPYIDY